MAYIESRKKTTDNSNYLYKDGKFYTSSEFNFHWSPSQPVTIVNNQLVFDNSGFSINVDPIGPETNGQYFVVEVIFQPTVANARMFAQTGVCEVNADAYLCASKGTGRHSYHDLEVQGNVIDINKKYASVEGFVAGTNEGASLQQFPEAYNLYSYTVSELIKFLEVWLWQINHRN